MIFFLFKGKPGSKIKKYLILCILAVAICSFNWSLFTLKPSQYNKYPAGDAIYYSNMSWYFFSPHREKLNITSIHSKRILAPFIANCFLRILGANLSNRIILAYNVVIKNSSMQQSPILLTYKGKQIYGKICQAWQILNFISYVIIVFSILALLSYVFDKKSLPSLVTILFAYSFSLIPTLGRIYVFWPQMCDLLGLALAFFATLLLVERKKLLAFLFLGFAAMAKENALFLIPGFLIIQIYYEVKIDRLFSRQTIVTLISRCWYLVLLSTLPYLLVCLFPYFPARKPFIDIASQSKEKHIGMLYDYGSILFFSFKYLSNISNVILMPLLYMLNLLPSILLFCISRSRIKKKYPTYVIFLVLAFLVITGFADRYVVWINIVILGIIASCNLNQKKTEPYVYIILPAFILCVLSLNIFAIGCRYLQIEFYRFLDLPYNFYFVVVVCYLFALIAIFGIIKKKQVFWLSWITGLTIWLFAISPFLIQNYIFSHDSMTYFPIFKYFYTSVSNMCFPLWDPFLHSGEQYFVQLGQWVLLDPMNLLGVVVGAVFKINNSILLYEIISFARFLVIALGIVLFYNELVPRNRRFSYFLFAVILLSTFTVNYYHQNGPLMGFLYLPYALFFFIKFMKSNKWLHAILFSYFLGITYQSQHAAYVTTFLLVFLVLYFAYTRMHLKTLIRRCKLKVLVIIFLFAALSSPLWILPGYSKNIFPYARFAQGKKSSSAFFYKYYKQLRNSGGAYGGVGDIVSLGIQPIAEIIYTKEVISKDIPMKMSEMNMYIGFFPFLIGLIGIFLGRNRYKWMFLALLAIFGFLLLGPVKYNLIYKVLFYLIPSLRLLHNYHEFAIYFMFCYFYFFCLGLDFLLGFRYYKELIATAFIITMGELYFFNHSIFKNPRLTSPGPLNTTARQLKDLFKNPFNRFKLQKRQIYFPSDFFHKQVTNNLLSACALKSMFVMLPTAIDPIYIRKEFEKNKPLYIMPLQYQPYSLVYPKLYANILGSNIPQKLKSILLGAGLSPLDFYTKYKIMPCKEILDFSKSKLVLKYLEEAILLPEKESLPLKLNHDSRLVWNYEVLDYTPNSLKLLVKNNIKGFLLFRDGYDPYWDVRVNGKPAQLLRANYNEKSVFLNKGISIVEFIYRPWKYIIALIVYFAANFFVLIFVLIFLATRKPSRRQNNKLFL